ATKMRAGTTNESPTRQEKAKGELQVVRLHAGRRPMAFSSRQESTRRAAQGNDPLAKRIVSLRQPQQLSARTTRTVTILTKRGKKIVVANISPKTFRPAHSRRGVKIVTFYERRHGRRRVIASLRRNFASEASVESSVRRVLIDNNYDPSDFAAAYSPETAPFPMRVNNEQLAYRLNSIFALPAEELTLVVGGTEKKGDYSLQTTLNVTQVGPNTWSWKAPREA